MSGMRRSSSRSPMTGMQITPLVCRTMNAIASGVTVVGGHDQVALVLAVGVVDDDHHPPRLDLLDGVLDRVERVPIRRPSSVTLLVAAHAAADRRPEHPFHVFGDHVHLEVHRVAGLGAPSVVTSSVCGMSATPNVRPSTPVTVRLTPSTVIEPFSTTYRSRSSGSSNSISRPSSWRVTAAPRPRRRRGPGPGGRPSRSVSSTGRSRFTRVAGPERAERGSRRTSPSRGRTRSCLVARRSTTVRHTPFTAIDAPMAELGDDRRQATVSRGPVEPGHAPELLNDPGEHPPPPSASVADPVRPTRCRARTALRDRGEAVAAQDAGGAASPPMSFGARNSTSRSTSPSSDGARGERRARPRAATDCDAALAEAGPQHRASETPPCGSAASATTSAPAAAPGHGASLRRGVGGRDQRRGAPSEQPPGRPATRPAPSTTTRSGWPAPVPVEADGERRVVDERRARRRPRPRRRRARRRWTSARASSPVIHRDEPSRAADLPVERRRRPSA